MNVQIHQLSLTTAEKETLDVILEFYIRLGLGQLSEIATRLRLLTEKRPKAVTEEVMQSLKALEAKLFEGERPWRLEDVATSPHTLLAFAIQAKLQGNMESLEWAMLRLREMRGETL